MYQKFISTLFLEHTVEQVKLQLIAHLPVCMINQLPT